MFKRLLGPKRFIITSMVALAIQTGFVMAAAIGEQTHSAAAGLIAIIASTLWVEDVEEGRNTRKKNKRYIIATLTAIFLTCTFTPAQAISPAIIIALIAEVVFMVAMLTDLNWLP